MTTPSESPVITITGIVTPFDWELDDSIKAVVIASPDETDYIVREPWAVRRLLPFLDRPVCAEGVVTGLEPLGQRLALRRVKALADLDPETVDLSLRWPPRCDGTEAVGRQAGAVRDPM